MKYNFATKNGEKSMEKLQTSEIHFDNLVESDLEKCCKMSILTQISALIEPRTRPPKFSLFELILSSCESPPFVLESLDGPFSAVSTPIFASEYSVLQIFRDQILQDYQRGFPGFAA